MSAVTPDGFQCDDLGTHLANLQAAMRTIFGQDIDLDTDTIDGQTLGIFAEAKADSDQLAEDVYNSWNPQTAVGVALSRLVELNGIRRIPAEPSQATITCGGTVRTHIPIGSLVASTATGAQFATIQDAIISDSGEVDISVMSQQYGAIQAPAGTITRIVTPVFGWQYVTNAMSAVLGRDMETDEQLRIRRAASTATPAQSVPESLYGAVANIPEVTQCRLYENYTGDFDANGLPPHSYCLVVEGGADEDIANQIWLRASLGATQVGNTTVEISDIQGFPHDITFQRPVPIRIYMAITLRPLVGWGNQLISEMANNIAEWAVENWQIGDSIIYSRIFEAINELPNVFSVTSMTVDIVSPPMNKADIIIPFASIASLAPSDIHITVSGTPTDPVPPSPTTRIYGGVGIAGGTAPLTASGTQVTLSNGVVLNQLQTTVEIVGQSWAFSPNNQYLYLLLYGGSRTFTDDISGFQFVFNSPITVIVSGTTMYLYQSSNVLSLPVQPRVRT